MASQDLRTGKITYFQADLTPLNKALDVLAGIGRDERIKNDVGTAVNALRHIVEHIQAERNGKA